MRNRVGDRAEPFRDALRMRRGEVVSDRELGEWCSQEPRFEQLGQSNQGGPVEPFQGREVSHGPRFTPSKNAASLTPTVGTTSARSRKSFRCSQLVSAIRRQPWHAAPWSGRVSCGASGLCSAHTGSFEHSRLSLAWILGRQLRWNARRLDSAQFDDGLSTVLDPAINTRSTRSAALHSHQLSRSLLERMCCSNVAPSARIAAAISLDNSIAERFCSLTIRSMPSGPTIIRNSRS